MTDLELKHQVERELEWEPRVDATHVGVAVRQGTVTLTGEVGTYLERLAAEKAVKRLAGVRAVANDLTVALAKDGQRTDSDIALAAAQMLDWNASVPKGAVKVTVSNGNVRLEGTVSYQYQRAAAQRAAEHIIGVKFVTNLITIKPTVAVPDLKDRIAAAFARNAALDARKVDIHANGGSVQLTGTVRSWSERRAAEEAAWAAPGVTTVEDRLAVEV